jgi:hypothetical protein
VSVSVVKLITATQIDPSGKIGTKAMSKTDKIIQLIPAPLGCECEYTTGRYKAVTCLALCESGDILPVYPVGGALAVRDNVKIIHQWPTS